MIFRTRQIVEPHPTFERKKENHSHATFQSSFLKSTASVPKKKKGFIRRVNFWCYVYEENDLIFTNPKAYHVQNTI